MKFTDETKEEKTNKYFDYGVHRVLLGQFELGGEGEGEKEYIEITVMHPDDGDITDTARVWFTTDKAANYSFNVLRQIYVHNAPKNAKDKARETFDAIPDTAKAVELLNEKLIGKEAWFSKYPSPTRTYTAQDGTIKKSVDKNVYGYEPKARPELLPENQSDSPLEGAEDVTGTEAAENIPSDW